MHFIFGMPQFQNMMALLSTTFRHSSRNEKCTKLTNHHRVGTGHELSDTKENILLKTNNIFGVAVAAERSRVSLPGIAVADEKYDS